MSYHCSSLPKLLVSQGLFPTAPSQPRLTISIEFLAFYCALFKRSCNAINALALALNVHYVRRGYRMTNHKVRMYLRLICCTDTSGLQGETVHEPFWRSLGRAVQWFDMLHVTLGSGRDERRLEMSRDEGSLKGVFKGSGCWGLPQRLLATIGCTRGSKVYSRSTHSRVVRGLLEIQGSREN